MITSVLFEEMVASTNDEEEARMSKGGGAFAFFCRTTGLKRGCLYSSLAEFICC